MLSWERSRAPVNRSSGSISKTRTAPTSIKPLATTNGNVQLLVACTSAPKTSGDTIPPTFAQVFIQPALAGANSPPTSIGMAQNTDTVASSEKNEAVKSPIVIV